jgi:hypothetical protein
LRAAWGGPMKWSLRNRSRLSRAMSRLRGSIETRRVLDEVEWHRWFAWYPAVVARDNERAYWAWLQFVERKTRQSRSTGEWIFAYRLASRRALPAASGPRTKMLNSARSDTTRSPSRPRPAGPTGWQRGLRGGVQRNGNSRPSRLYCLGLEPPEAPCASGPERLLSST